MLPGAAALFALLLLTSACSDDDTTTAISTTSTSSTTGAPADPMPSSDDAFPDGLRGVRYCEVLLLSETGAGFVAEVWNTLGLNDCPQDQWDAIDAAAITEERSVLLALKNGPRYWTLDTILSDIRDGAEETAFGGMAMFLAATVELGDELPSQTPYTERSVVRETTFRFRGGTEVHELTDPDGTTYVMQSFSQAIDPTLDAARLSGLGDELDLPDGWTFASHTLDEQLDVLSTDGIATVIQDDLQNTYQRIDG